MKAALLYGPRDIRLADVPDPVAGPREVIVKMSFCGVCGTDLHGWEGWHRGGEAAFQPRRGTWVTRSRVSSRISARM